MNKADLAESLVAKGLAETKTQATQCVELIIENIKNAVNSGDKVSIAGFGIFTKKTYAEREARNPRTGEMVTVPKQSRVKFAPAKDFKELVK